MVKKEARKVVLKDAQGGYLVPVIDPADKGGSGNYTPNLLDTKWSDHILNDIRWLRGDTFSWQDGILYSAVYNLLLEALGTKVQMYCWSNADDSHWFWTLSETPQAGDRLYGWGDEYVTCDVGTVNNVVDNNTIYLTTVLNPNDGSVVTLNTNFTRNSSKDKQSYTCHFERFNGITVYVNQRPNGLKIAMPNQEQAILNLYNTTGVAWYYILDTTNTRFKLPRTKYDFVGLRDSVGGYVPESLPNIKGSVYLGTTTVEGTGAMSVDKLVGHGSTSGTSTDRIYFNASDYNTTYQDDAPVQQRATQMYLYFYVGDYAQTAIEQTAGLNAELFNGKVDIDLNNLSTIGQAKFDEKVNLNLANSTPTHDFATKLNNAQIRTIITTYQNGSSWYRIYSDGWCEQGGNILVNGTKTLEFLKHFKNTNYNFFVQSTYTGGNTIVMVMDNTKSISSIQISPGYHNSGNSDWIACGYLADGQY